MGRGLLALVSAGSFVGIELASTYLTLPLTSRELSCFCSFTVPLPLSSSSPFPCKTPLLLLGIVGLAATLLEFEEGTSASSVEKLQNKHKHHPFHHVDRVRHKRNSALDQVGPGEEPTTMEGVEDIEDRKVDIPRMRPRGCPSLHSGLVMATGVDMGGGGCSDTL
ncbi:hypothetical protein BJY52DRAFT_1231505 [Lactarius psammicola]|nr:hypothetical protein BJY52DRAFT_1231505 [Lactarius psammicola]